MAAAGGAIVFCCCTAAGGAVQLPLLFSGAVQLRVVLHTLHMCDVGQCGQAIRAAALGYSVRINRWFAVMCAGGLSAA